jgi:ABC-2 type transport system permease protein
MAAAAEPLLGGRPRSLSRVWGFGSVFGKALRDSRWSLLGTTVLVGLVTVLVAATLGLSFPAAADRARLVGQMEALPALFRGLLGEPLAIDRLPGFISWRALNFMPILVGIWSVLALSGAVAGEVGKGSMELLAAMPVSRWSIALQKAAAHVVALFTALGMAALITWLATLAFAALPGDEASLGASLAAYAWIGVTALFGGAVAFLLGPIVGRTAAAGAGAIVLFASFVIHGFAEAVTFFEQIRFLSIFHWTTGHRPLAGVEDWAQVLGVMTLDAALLGLGAVAFVRRDIGGLVGAGWSPFAAGWSIAGPTARSLAERLPVALAFGLGIGAFGFYIAISAESFSEVMAQVPEMRSILETFFPNVELFSAAGILELMFVEFAVLLLGLAAAVLVHGWASDERDRRLEMVLAAPVERSRWALASGWGVLLAAAALTVAVAVPASLGVLAVGDEVGPSTMGVAVLGVYTAALVGVGLAVGGFISPALAGPAVGLYVLAAFVIELVGSVLGLPAWLLDVSLARHLGQPFIGQVDALGMVACAALALGGLAAGAWGLARRDLRA